VTFIVAKCMSPEEVRTTVAKVAGIDVAACGVPKVFCEPLNRKRSAAVVVTATLPLYGSSSMGATAMTSSITAAVGTSEAAAFGLVSAAPVEAAAAEVVVLPALVGAEIAAGAVAGGAALGAGAIAGIVIGSVVLVSAVVVGGLAVRHKKKKAVTVEQTTSENELTPKDNTNNKPKGASVNVFDMDPNDPQSITARAPPQKNPKNVTVV